MKAVAVGTVQGVAAAVAFFLTIGAVCLGGMWLNGDLNFSEQSIDCAVEYEFLSGAMLDTFQSLGPKRLYIIQCVDALNQQTEG